MIILKGSEKDVADISDLYSAIHNAEADGVLSIGWIPDVYPIPQTAIDAAKRGDLFVLKDNNRIVASAIINHIQLDYYSKGRWQYPASDNDVMVLHTLVVDPRVKSKGYGTAFVRFFEQYAIEHNSYVLRMDTQEKNMAARKLYNHLGYSEADKISVEAVYGLSNLSLVLLEKKLS